MKNLKNTIKTIMNKHKKTLHTIYIIYFTINILVNIIKITSFIISYI